jgi:hypothetical protein
VVGVVVAAVLATAADTVLAAHHLPKLGAHLITARPVEKIAWRQEARERKKARGGEGGDNTAACDEIFGSCAAGNMKHTALCVQWQVLIVAAMYLRSSSYE